MVGCLDAAVDRVEIVLRVQLLVPVKIEGVAVELVGARLRYDVDDGTARTSVLGGIGVGVDLEFLDRVQAELVRGPARARSSQGLPEERVVVVGAVHDDAVQGPALAREDEVTDPDIVLDDSGCREHDV